jgi:hypothetical protein
MLYYSLNKQSPTVDFKQATIAGQADKGLYFQNLFLKLKRILSTILSNIAMKKLLSKSSNLMLVIVFQMMNSNALFQKQSTLKYH